MKNEKGFSLMEVMIAIALVGVVAVAFLSGLATASKAIFFADERATAESLARTEMEYVRNQDYSGAPWAYELPLHTLSNPPPDPPSWWAAYTPALPEGYDDYTVNVSAVPLHDTDDGIQEITVSVRHLEKPEAIVTLEGYRSLR